VHSGRPGPAYPAGGCLQQQFINPCGIEVLYGGSGSGQRQRHVDY
jgi:hypothetical protein